MLDFPRLASDYRIPILDSGHHHCHEGWIQTHCPRCAGSQGGWHLGFSLERGNFNCWRCGTIPTLEVVSSLLHLSKSQAIEILQKYKLKFRIESLKKPKTRNRTINPPKGVGPLEKQHWRYLKSRGFYQSHVKQWEIQGTCHLSLEWSWRLIFPVKNQDGGSVLAYLGRSIKEVKPKYRLTENSKCLEDPSGFLYGIHKVPRDSVVIVEGPTDVWRIGPGAVATLGIDWKIPQANTLRRFQNRFVMYDPEPKAQEKAEELAAWLSLYPGRTEVIQDLRTDPGGLSEREAKRIRKELLGN